jgi:hypothetical protein
LPSFFHSLCDQLPQSTVFIIVHILIFVSTVNLDASFFFFFFLQDTSLLFLMGSFLLKIPNILVTLPCRWV